jgi:phage-related protein
MALETLTWKGLLSDPQGTVSHRVLSAKFGDGYEQVAADGINPAQQSWPLTFTERSEFINPLRDFLDRHGSYKPFLWTPPLGQQGTYRTDKGYQFTAHGADLYTLTVTLVQFNRP